MPDRSKEIYSPDGQLIRTLPMGTRFQKADTDLMALVPSLPERVEVVQKIYRLYVEENLGQYAIVNRLNGELKKGIGILSARASPGPSARSRKSSRTSTTPATRSSTAGRWGSSSS